MLVRKKGNAGKLLTSHPRMMGGVHIVEEEEECNLHTGLADYPQLQLIYCMVNQIRHNGVHV